MKEVAKSEMILGELQKVFDSDQSRTKMGRLREMFDAIEQKRDGGMSLENIRLVLEQNGFAIRLPTLTQYLHRIRQERSTENITATEEKPKPVESTKKVKAEKVKSTIKNPAAPDILDDGKMGVQAGGNNGEEESEILTEKQKRERKAAQYVNADDSNTYLNNFINSKDN